MKSKYNIPNHLVYLLALESCFEQWAGVLHNLSGCPFIPWPFSRKLLSRCLLTQTSKHAQGFLVLPEESKFSFRYLKRLLIRRVKIWKNLVQKATCTCHLLIEPSFRDANFFLFFFWPAFFRLNSAGSYPESCKDCSLCRMMCKVWIIPDKWTHHQHTIGAIIFLISN